MGKEYWKTATLGTGFFFCSVALQTKPSLFYLAGVAIFFLGLVVQLIVTVVIGLTRWRKSSRSWMMPSVICLIFILSYPVGSRFGVFFSDWRFRKHLQEYVQIVDDVKLGRIPSNSTLGEISSHFMPADVAQAMALRHADGAVIVVFLVGSGFPLHHTGYVFKGCAENTNCTAQYDSLVGKWDLRHEVDNWYRFSQ